MLARLLPVQSNGLLLAIRELIHAEHAVVVHTIDEVMRQHTPLVETHPTVRGDEAAHSHINIVADSTLRPVDKPPLDPRNREADRSDERLVDQLIAIRRHGRDRQALQRYEVLPLPILDPPK